MTRPLLAVIAAAWMMPATLAARPAKAVPFAPGEVLTYDISWSSFVTAGTATMTVKERKPSYKSEAYYITAEGRPAPLVSKLYDLYYKADTLLDVYTLQSQRGSIYSQEGRRRRNKVTIFNHELRRAQYEFQTATVVKKNVPIERNARDVLGALYAVRAFPLKTGSRFSIPICDGGETYVARIEVGPPELVKTGIGSIRAWKVSPALPDAVAPAGAITLWLSDDARRIPVRIRAQLPVGTFDFTLKSASR